MKAFLTIFLLLCGAAAVESAPSEAEAVFPIGGFSGRPERDQQAGFTVCGPHYRSADRRLEECRRIGMPIIYPVGVRVDFRQKGRGASAASLDFAQIKADIRQQVGRVANESLIYAWYLVPEELRYWRTQEAQYLRVAAEAIREADPRKRPVWMYEPNHRDQAALEKTLPYLQIAGKGLYASYIGRKDARAWISWSLAQQAQAIAAINPEAIPFAVLEMFQEPPDGEVQSIPTRVRHDCYASLIAGVRGIMIFSFGSRAGFPSRPVYYDAYARVARELNGPLKLGAVFLQGEKVTPPNFQIIGGQPTVTLPAGSSPKKATVVPSVESASYHWKGHDWFFAVNSSGEPITLKFMQPRRWLPLLEDQPSMAADDRTLVLPPLAVGAFRTDDLP